MPTANEFDEYEFFERRGLPRPDLVFDAGLFDSQLHIETGESLPLREQRGQYTPGCYAWLNLNERP